MQFTISQEDLERVLSVCLRCIPSKPSMPQLAGILFRKEGSKLTATATDLDVQVTVELPRVNLEEEGELWLPAKETFDLVRRLPEDVLVELRQAGSNQVLLSYPGGEARLAGMDPGEFPLIEQSVEEVLEFPGEGLLDALRYVLYAAAPDDLRPIFTGVEISYSSPEGELTFAATDGHRLAVFRRGEEPRLESRVVPAQYLKEVLVLGRLLGEEPKRIRLGKTTASFHWEEVELYSRLIEGKFPDWQQALPKDPPATSLSLTVGTLLSCLERARVIARAQASGVPAVFLVKEGEGVRIEARSEAGEFKEHVDGRAEGEDLTLAFNADYLMEALRVLDREAEVLVSLYGPMAPIIITSGSCKEYLALVLPLRLV
ncbi:DNA polymerase III, beta subunit [Ammonifex degensii KC4]|uniref:Beta sliding clamp n=1 Tax=Ammonifex degensii (strain DSM 10501 / KC4) TaxID=429009 RepID=C9RA70_AMMDK|nr:DNA polymerase III subunit beta [Ammonifex degensii]ACX51179.1 DNA polymerase III, beta subunit [Ammonifex degensii KC4]